MTNLTLELDAEGRGLRLGFEGHTVLVGNAEALWLVANRALNARAMGAAKIATDGAPLQAMVDAWLKSNKPKRLREDGRAEKVEITLEELGLA